MEHLGLTIPMLVWGSIAFTLIVAFGCTAWDKLRALNSKRGIVTWSDYEVEIVFEETGEEEPEPLEEPIGLGEMIGWDALGSVSMTFYE